MTEDRRQILTMLAEGKITTEEADRLLAAFDRAAPRRRRSRDVRAVTCVWKSTGTMMEEIARSASTSAFR